MKARSLRSLGALALSLALTGSASAGWNIYVVGPNSGVPVPADGDAFLASLLAKYGGSTPNVKHIFVARFMGGMPRGFGAEKVGQQSSIKSFDVAGTTCHVYAHKVAVASGSASSVDAFALEDRDANWLWEKARDAVELGDGAKLMVNALKLRLRGNQENETVNYAKQFFEEALYDPDYRDLEEEDPVVRRFAGKVRTMSTSTGALTFRNRSEGRELADRALALLREAWNEQVAEDIAENGESERETKAAPVMGN